MKDIPLSDLVKKASEKAAMEWWNPRLKIRADRLKRKAEDEEWMRERQAELPFEDD